jgi:hypothetical protein
MIDLELEHLRREKWRLEGEPVRTLEQAREFVDSVGVCLMYAPRPTPVIPTFIAATMGSDLRPPTRKAALSDPRAAIAEELLLRLIRNRFAYAVPFYGETLIVSPQLFPYYYALASDRKPKQPLRSRAREKVSPLSSHVFQKLEEKGPMARVTLQEELGGALSLSALDRSLHELWAGLKIAEIDRDVDAGEMWDVFYRWAPDAVAEGVRTSDAEALSALISKYLDAVVAATPEDVENFFSAFASRARVREVINALLAAREFAYSPGENRTLITVAHRSSRAEMPPESDGTRNPGLPIVRRRRNG